MLKSRNNSENSRDLSFVSYPSTNSTKPSSLEGSPTYPHRILYNSRAENTQSIVNHLILRALQSCTTAEERTLARMLMKITMAPEAMNNHLSNAKSWSFDFERLASNYKGLRDIFKTLAGKTEPDVVKSLVQSLLLWLDEFKNDRHNDYATQWKYQKYLLNLRKKQLKKAKLRLRNRLSGKGDGIEYEDLFSIKGNIGKRRDEIHEVMAGKEMLAKDIEIEQDKILKLRKAVESMRLDISMLLEDTFSQ